VVDLASVHHRVPSQKRRPCTNDEASAN
jgi:hypothetical protein